MLHISIKNGRSNALMRYRKSNALPLFPQVSTATVTGNAFSFITRKIKKVKNIRIRKNALLRYRCKNSGGGAA